MFRVCTGVRAAIFGGEIRGKGGGTDVSVAGFEGMEHDFFGDVGGSKGY